MWAIATHGTFIKIEEKRKRKRRGKEQERKSKEGKKEEKRKKEAAFRIPEEARKRKGKKEMSICGRCLLFERMGIAKVSLKYR